jgi:Chaperone of endosialidase
MKKICLLLSLVVIFIGVHAQAPVNDEPCGAITIPVLAADPISNVGCYPTVQYIYLNATGSIGIPNPSCNYGGVPQNIRDVWYKFIVPASGRMKITSLGFSGFYNFTIYSGATCSGTLTELNCASLQSPFNNIMPLTGLTASSAIYLRIMQTSDVNNGIVSICATDYYLSMPTIDNTTKIGIGTTEPLAKLDVAGTGVFRDSVIFAKKIDIRNGLKIMSGASNERVLTSDADGNANWENLPSGAYTWSLNMNTNDIYNTTLNKNVGIGTSNPQARLHVADSSVLFTGQNEFAIKGNPPVSGTGGRMMWYADKSALRAGYVQGPNWNKDSIGYGSFATGYSTKAKGVVSCSFGSVTTASGNFSTSMGANTIASGFISTSMGNNTNATGDYSTSLGSNTTASALYTTSMGYNTTATTTYATSIGVGTTASGAASTSMGSNTIASGLISTSMGTGTTASGNYSTSMGLLTKAKATASLAIGKYNDTSATNRLFEIGNGFSDNVRSNALTVLDNGNVGIAITSPTNRLSVVGNADFTGNVGIGTTTPTSKLTVNGQLTVDQKALGGYGGLLLKGNVPGSNYPNIAFTIKNNAATPIDEVAAMIQGDLQNNTAGAETVDLTFLTSQNGLVGLSEKFRIKGNGNIGIGTGTPNAPLQFFNNAINRKIVLYETVNNDHQYYGFGINAAVLRYQVDGTSSNHIFYAGTSATTSNELFRIIGNGNAVLAGTLTQSSDIRLKKNIVPLHLSLNKLTQLNGYTYNWISKDKDPNEQIGLIAQEVQKLYPQLVTEVKGENGETTLAVNYTGLIPILIESVKELKKNNEEQQKQIDELKLLVQKLLNK